MLDLAWPIVGLVVVAVVNHRWGQWMRSRVPLATKQYEELHVLIKDLQNQVSRLSIDKGFD